MDRKLEIIQCARELIEERGLAKTSVAAITERMNVARTLFYHCLLYTSDAADD